MRLHRAAGFSLVEMMIAIALSGAVAGAMFLLLDVGMDAQEQASELTLDLVGTSELANLLRSDLARAQDVVHAGADSLELRLFDGERVAYAARTTGDGVLIYRSRNPGAGWKEDPLRPVATLDDGHGQTGRVEFAALGSSRVRARLWNDGRPFEIEGALWRTP